MNIRHSGIALGLGLLALSGCTHMQLRPAPGAQQVPDLPLAASDHAAGVHVTVQPDAWSGSPERLERELTPMKVSIENRGDKPVRISYEDFAIETGSGIRYTPLPPLNIKGEVTESTDVPVHVPRYAITPRFAHRGFWLAPWYVPYYAGLRSWWYPWAFKSWYYDTHYPRWTVKLPTADMLAMAIPEGVIEPGGEVSGFLYFPALDDDLERITFKGNFSVPQDGERVAQISVPFVVT